MSKKLGMLLLCLVLAVTSALTLAGCAPKGAIKLGALAPLSGPSAATGQEMKNAFLMAQEEVNAAGGILGRKVEILVEDSKDATAAVASFEKLITKDNVPVVMGEVSSTVVKALAEPAKKYQQQYAPIMALTGAAARAVEQAFGDADWFFHYHPWEYMNVDTLKNFLVAAKVPNIVVAHEDGLFGTSNVDMLKEALKDTGIKILGFEPFKSGSPDLSALLTKIKGYKPDTLVWIGYPADAIPMVTQSKEAGFNPNLIVAYTPGWPKDFGKVKEAEYMAGLVVWSPDAAPTPEAKKFNDAYKAKFGSAPNSYWAPLAYTNAMTVMDAIKTAGKLDQAQIKKALAATKYASPLGMELSFKPSRVAKYQGFTNLIIVQWRGGKQEIVFPDKLATTQLTYPVPNWKDRK
ncbi:MAG TPA: ABC transporter substrate-binding protein [Bacillota bacterium]